MQPPIKTIVGSSVSARFALALAALAVALLTAGFVAQVTARTVVADDVSIVVSTLTTTAVGLFICVRRPGHRVGWIVLALGFAASAQAALAGYFETQPAAGWLYTTLLWIDGRSFLTLWGGLIALFFTFPDGHLPSPRWRPAARASAAAIVLGVVVMAVEPGPLAEELPAGMANAVNPVALPADVWARVQFLGPIALAGVVAALLLSLTSLVARYRGSRPQQRMQIRWVVAAAATFVAVLVINVVVRHAEPALLESVDVATGLAFMLLPLSVGVAVMRYRLYEIDRVINRAVVYGILTATLAIAYVAAVAAARVVTEPFTGDAAVAVAASTLAVAALFQPLRRRIQQAVDRRFNRARYDAAATIHAFSARLREEVDLTTLRTELVGVVHATMLPTATSLWLRERQP